MSSKYQQLEELKKLLDSGAISEEEYQREKERILDDNSSQATYKNNSLGMEENTYLLLMHISQLAGFLTGGLGFAIPLVMWLIGKDKNENVNKHGRNILNFMISWFIYVGALGVLSLIFILLLVTIPLGIICLSIMGVVALLEIIFIIIASVKAANGEYWKYPASITFFS